MSTIGSMWVREGHVVVFRKLDSHSYQGKGPKVGLVIRETDDGVVTIRTACGNRRYCARAVEVKKEWVAREATAREAIIGHPIHPVPPAPVGAAK